jgi:hypothetical protein
LLATVPPQPFQPALIAAAVNAGGAAVQRPTLEGGAAAPIGRPARNPATARRSASVSSEPCRNMLPLVSAVRIASGAIAASVSRRGARESAAGCAWQLAHAFS